MNMLKRLALLMVMLGLIAGCSTATVQPATPTATPQPADTATPSPIPPSPTPAPTNTATPEPSPTLEPTPTFTPEPTLPPVPDGMTVERLDPALYAVRAAAPGTNVRAEPSTQAEVTAKFECGAAPLLLDAVASGDASGKLWYHAADGGWIREDVIETHADAAEAEAAAKAANCAAAITGGETDYTPAAAQVWNFVQSPDNMSGACTGGAVLPPYGLVQIIPGAGSLTWRSQEPAPYTFVKVATNVYAYSGPTSVGDGTVSMSLTFTGAGTAQMTRAFTPNNDPACTHTHYYTATFQWAVP
jgi:hypothetical protein